MTTLIDNNDEIMIINIIIEGESGKSTIVKQMKIINNNGQGYPEEEKRAQIGVIRKNVLDSIENLLLGRSENDPTICRKSLGLNCYCLLSNTRFFFMF